VTEGLARLSIQHETTLPYSAYQYVLEQFMFSSFAEARDL